MGAWRPVHILSAAWLLALCAAPTQASTSVVRDMGNLISDWCTVGWVLGSQPPCTFQAPTPLFYREYAQYWVAIPANASFDLVIVVKSEEGDVDIKLYGPDKTRVLASSAERIGEDVVALARSDLQQQPGNYTLEVQAVAGAQTQYTITVQGVTRAPRLAAEEVALMASISAQCCSPDDDLLPDACTRLAAAVAPNATAEQDLCAQPPNLCDPDTGRLVKLVLSGGDKGNFVCPSFPAELGQLRSLQVLDWTSNGQVGTLSSVASVLAPLAGQLRRLYLGRNALSGPLECSLVGAGSALEVLWLESNLLEGTVPSCLLASRSLRQLSLSNNLLRGPLPPPPPGCPLVVLDVSENGPPLGASALNPGLQGSLPAELANAVNLTILDVSSNSLTGSLPALGSRIQVLRAAHNGLGGSIPASLGQATDLRVLDLEANALEGGVAEELVNNPLLTVLRLAGNRLSGPLPVGGWGGQLLEVDLSDNQLTGGYTQLVSRPSLISLNLARNRLTLDIGNVSRSLVSRNSMLYFNVSHNSISGQLLSGLGALRLFNQLQLQAIEDDNLAGSLPPQPVFDVSGNLIRSPFPTWLLPLLGQLYWQSPYDYLPLALALQPQQPAPATDPASGATPGLACPDPDTPLPAGVYYLDELQGLYDLSCVAFPSGLRVNISSYTLLSPTRPPLPPKPPAPPSPPPPSPPRPPRRRPPLPPSPPGTAGTGSSPGSSLPPLPPPAGGGADKGGSPPAAAGGGSEKGGGVASPPLAVSGGEPGAGAGPGASPAPAQSGGAGGAAGPGTADTQSGKAKGGSMGVIGGAIGGGVAVLLLVALVAWLLVGRRRKQAYASKRTPLTYNSAYEAQSDGTASNYGDLQMFEFRTTDRPARHRARMQ